MTKREKEEEEEKDLPSPGSLPQMATMAGAVQDKEPRTASRFPTWVVGPQI